METLFVDDIENVSYKDGLIKVVWGNEASVKNEDVKSNTALVMSVSTFLSFYNTSKKMFDKMVEMGALKVTEDE